MLKRAEIKAALENADDKELTRISNVIHEQFFHDGFRIDRNRRLDSILVAADKDERVESVLCALLNIPRPRDESTDIAKRALKRSREANIVAFGALLMSLIAILLSR